MPRKDPYKNFRFSVEIDGIEQAAFREVTIPNSTQEPIEYREGNEPEHARKLPGLNKYGNVTLKWGITDSMELYNWRKQIEDGNIDEARKNISILMHNDLRSEKGDLRWELGNAWPTVYTAPELNGTGNEIAIESLEIVCETIERTK